MNARERHRRDYRESLQHFLTGAGEDALAKGYETGRRMLADGISILDIASMHYESVAQLLPARRGKSTSLSMGKAAEFFIECLSPYDISHRGIGEANAALRRLNELLEEDIRRVAHALHDQASSILASATIELDLVTKELEPAVRARLALVSQLINETGEKLRHFSHELRPTLLDDLGLGAALDFLAEGIEQRSCIRVILSINLRERPAMVVETALYRVVQEALNNAVRHAGKSPIVTILIERNEDNVHCVVADDGIGFDVNAIFAEVKTRGIGLLCMRERVLAVGGIFEIRSTAQQGTTIEIIVPFNGSGDRLQ